MIPKVLLQKHLGLETTAYHEVLDAHFRRFRNFFADGSPTKQSLGSLLALDKDYYNQAVRNNTVTYFFPGMIPSPLFEIFKYNGYTTTTFHYGPHFGVEKGPYVDNFYNEYNFSLVNGVCDFIDTEGWRKPTFLGYCALIKSWKVRTALTKLGILDQSKQDIDFLIDHMREGLQKDEPQIIVAYLFSPGHTPYRKFDRKIEGALDKYKQYYLDKSKETALKLKKLVTFVASEDPQSIVYVFGDHGPYISGWEFFDDNYTFMIQDRFGVYGGIYPRDRCVESFAKPGHLD